MATIDIGEMLNKFQVGSERQLWSNVNVNSRSASDCVFLYIRNMRKLGENTFHVFPVSNSFKL
jgi:hypothetical protein